MLPTGPPVRTEHTIDQCRFTREPDAAPARTLSITTQAALENAVDLIRAILRDVQHTAG